LVPPRPPSERPGDGVRTLYVHLLDGDMAPALEVDASIPILESIPMAESELAATA
jgi:hypothetical protein